MKGCMSSIGRISVLVGLASYMIIVKTFDESIIISLVLALVAVIGIFVLHGSSTRGRTTIDALYRPGNQTGHLMSIMSFIFRVTELSLGVLVGLSFTLLDPLYICVSLFCYIMVTTLTRSVSRYKTKNFIPTIAQLATLITLFCLLTLVVLPSIHSNDINHDAQLNSTSADPFNNNTDPLPPQGYHMYTQAEQMCAANPNNCWFFYNPLGTPPPR